MRCLLYILPSTLFCFQWQSAWYPELFEIQWENGYTFSHYHSVQGATHNRSSSMNLYFSNLNVAFSDTLAIGAEMEIMGATDFTWGFRSGALDGSVLLMDDVPGYDPISLVAGLTVRGVPERMLTNPNTPYHGQFTGELFLVGGKEWSHEEYWTMHMSLFASVGQGRGYPWNRLQFLFELNSKDIHRGSLFARSYLGWGGSHELNLNKFDGYSYIQHRNIEVGLTYTYIFDLWGQVTLEVMQEVYAHLYPKNTLTAQLSYTLPFSF